MGVLTNQERKAKIGDIVEKVTQMSDEQLEMFMNIHPMNLKNPITRQ